MGPVNWIAVLLAAMVAAGIAWPWYRLMGRRMPHALRLIALFLPASLIGHNFARVGADMLTAKPWLYLMMSGGFALSVIIPAQVVSDGRHGIAWRETAVDAGYWLVSFLAMGGVFWVFKA
jgi:hypothetical protein